MKKIAVVLFWMVAGLSATCAVEINARGQVLFQTDEGQRVQYADALNIKDITGDQWRLAGDENAVAAISGTDKLRFYRVVAEGESSPAQYALGVVKLFAGRNWVGLWGDPENNTLTGIFGTRLPAGMIFKLDEGEAGIPAGASAVEIELPAVSEPLVLPVILKIPTEPVTQVIPFEKRILCGFRCAGRPRLDQAGLIEGGFSGAENPKDSDQLWKYNRREQRAPFAVWFCTKDNSWRLTSGPDFPLVPEDYFRYDDAVTVYPRRSTGGINWTKPASR